MINQMKSIFPLIFVLILVQGCSSSRACLSEGPKNLIKNSEFAIVTPKHDTLFLCNDDQMGRLLAECWKEGKFRDGSAQPKVMVLDCTNFEKVAKRIAVNSDLMLSEATR